MDEKDCELDLERPDTMERIAAVMRCPLRSDTKTKIPTMT